MPALTQDALRALPKVELHCHLDGSVPLPFYEALAGLGIPGVPWGGAALRAAAEAPFPCRNLAQYLESFALPLRVLQDPGILWEATMALMGTLKEETVLYAELRFAPLPLVGEKASADTLVRTVTEALCAAQKQHGIAAQAILCMMRHNTEKENETVLALAEKYLGRGVAGVDLAGDEAAWPTALYKGIFQKATARGLPFTIHAGECGSTENIRESVAMGARRIGHGIAAGGDDELCRLLAAEGILLESCPLSNLQTGAVASLEDHPLPRFAAAGVPVCINTDNRTVSNTSLTHEYAALLNHLPGLDKAFLKARSLQALEGAFLPKSEKAPIREALEKGYAAREEPV